MNIKLTKEELNFILSLVEIERSLTRFTLGFGRPTKTILEKENFMDKIIKKLKLKQ